MRERRRAVKNADGMPADFLFGVLKNFPAQRIREQLPAETNPEDRFLRLDRCGDESFLRHEPREVAVLLNAHRPAHDHEQIESIERRQFRARRQRGAGESVAAFKRPVGDDARSIQRVVFENLNSHGGRK